MLDILLWSILWLSWTQAAPTAGRQVPVTTPMARCVEGTFAARPDPGVTIRAVRFIEPGTFAPVAAVKDLTGFCRVEASVSAATGSLITFEVWVPPQWNGKLVATGNGGYSNVPSYRDMAFALQQGYAASGGDTGHQTPTPDDLLWGVDHPERIEDWGSRSIHATAAPARGIVEALTGRPPARAYFYGCSTGGHQAYAEMQRFPEDFDGIVAGAPGNNRVRLNAAFLWRFLANRENGDNNTLIVPASKLPLITRAVIAACDKNDGVADGVVDDPRTCVFDPRSLRCTGEDGPTCLTDRQLAAMQRMYEGPRDSRGRQVYPGFPKGSEAATMQPNGSPGSGWHQYWGDAEPARVNFWRYWVFNNPNWDWWRFDIDRDVSEADQKVGRLVDQTSTDLARFKSSNRKAIVYQGWQDGVVNALDTIDYVERVRAAQGADTNSFLRLFLVPGMGHCSGGMGTTSFGNMNSPSPVVDAEHDLLSALDAWIERGRAPDRIIASRVVDGTTVRTRPLCVYPQRAVYNGTGSTDDARNFVCRAPSPRPNREPSRQPSREIQLGPRFLF
jgi:feruloyl esterase